MIRKTVKIRPIDRSPSATPCNIVQIVWWQSILGRPHQYINTTANTNNISLKLNKTAHQVHVVFVRCGLFGACALCWQFQNDCPWPYYQSLSDSCMWTIYRNSILYIIPDWGRAVLLRPFQSVLNAAARLVLKKWKWIASHQLFAMIYTAWLLARFWTTWSRISPECNKYRQSENAVHTQSLPHM